MINKSWREVTDAELCTLWDDRKAAGRCIYNGCTDDWLRERYGAYNIKHVMGDGWYIAEPVSYWVYP